MLKLLIAVDGSDHARRAIEAAARLTRGLPEVDVLLLNVREPSVYYGEFAAYDFEAVDRSSRDYQASVLATALTHARECGLSQVSTQGEFGAPAQEIARVARECGVDEIVMGTRGMNALAGLVLGSVAQRVVHFADVPVLMVK